MVGTRVQPQPVATPLRSYFTLWLGPLSGASTTSVYHHADVSALMYICDRDCMFQGQDATDWLLLSLHRQALHSELQQLTKVSIYPISSVLQRPGTEAYMMILCDHQL